MKNLIFLSSLIFLITACSKKDENISIEKKYSQNSLESKYEKEILNRMQIVPFSQIKGFFDDLIKEKSEDFLMAELLDEGPVIDAMARLRQKYPRMMTIQSHRRMNSGSGERSFDLMKKVDPLDMFRVFYKEFQDKEFTEEEEDYMKELWDDLRKEDD